jgi:hypothetical protein
VGASGSQPTAQEVLFEAQAIADTNNNVLFTLGQLAKEFPEMIPTLRASLEVRVRFVVCPYRRGARACVCSRVHVFTSLWLLLQSSGLRMPQRPPSRAPGAV